MTRKSKKAALLNTALTPLSAKQKLGLMSLEPRLLLDAAGFVTGAEVAIDAMNQDDAAMATAEIFENTAVKNEWLDQYSGLFEAHALEDVNLEADYELFAFETVSETKDSENISDIRTPPVTEVLSPLDNNKATLLTTIQASSETDASLDTDSDGVLDTDDIDDDNDGILDTAEGDGGTFIGQFDYAVDEFDTDGVIGFSSSVAELDGEEITTGQSSDQQDGDRSPLLSEGDVITYSLNEGTLILAISIDSLSSDAEIGIRYRDAGGNPNFELRGVDDAINAEESAGLSLQFFDATDPAFAAANGLGDIAQIISGGGGDAVQVTSSIRISDIDLDGRLEGVSASLDSLASYTIEGDNGSFTPVIEDDFVVFRGTVVDPDDNVQLNFLNTDIIQINLLNNQDSRAGFSFNFSQFNFDTAETTTTGQDSDGDGIDDHLDIDSDNDGITDNIEAQSTAGYIAPNADDAATLTANNGLNSAYVGTNGLTAVDTDSDGFADAIDTNSDNQGEGDTLEAGLTGTAAGQSTATTDADGDGLFDVFDTQNGTTADDGFDVNESITAGAAALPDVDADASGGVPLAEDVDFRDATLPLDTDGDGVADDVDVDDDNDGILDVDEGVQTQQVQGQLQFNHNENGGTGIGPSFVEFGGSPRVSDVIASGEDTVIGDGLTVLMTGQGTDNASIFEFDLEGADSDTFEEALAAEDFIEMSFTTQDTLSSLRFLFHSFSAQDAGGSNRGDYRVSYLISDDGFETSDVLVDDFQFQSGTSGSFNGQFPPFEEYFLDPETRYSVRVYVYDAQNNPAGQITFNDQTFEFNQVIELDSDNDGIVNRLDIDSDNDGITDNIEAQTTADYIAPSGVGGTPSFIDVNQDGLDDNYDNRNADNGDILDANSAAATSADALINPVNTDGDNDADFLDTNSDNEGGNDTDEAGLTGTANGLSTTSNDADGDGLFDVFDTQNSTTDSDGFVVNEGIETGAISLPDVDSDASGGVPLTADVDFRDNVTSNSAPIAEDDSFATDEEAVVSGNVFLDNGNGVDSDLNNDNFVVSEIYGIAANVGNQITLPSGALLTLNANGSFDYDPNGAFDFLDTGETGLDTFEYTIDDGNGDTDTAIVTITLSGDNDVPVIDLNGAALGTDFADVFVEDEPGQPLANLVSFDAVIQDDEDNIAMVNIIPSLPIQNDGTDEFLRIDSDGIDLSIRLIDGEIITNTPLVFGDTTFAVTFVAGVVSITNADGGTFDSDDLQGFLRLLAYENVNQDNSDGIRAFNFQVVDPAGVTVATSTITVDRVNDAPVPTVSTTANGTVVEFGVDTPEAFAVVSSDSLITEITVAELLAQLDITDIEDSDFGIAIIGADETQGVWQYIRPDIEGHEWTDFQLGDADNTDATPVPDGQALLLDPDTIIRFVADAGFSSDAALVFRVWDQTVGTASNPPSTIVDDSGAVAPFNTSSLSSTAFAVSLAADTDGDGVINADDVDDDNDGILDVDEGFQEETTNLNFEPDALNGADIDVIQQGDVFVYRDAITRPDGSTFDITLTFDTFSLNTDGSTIDNVRITSNGAINIVGFDSGENDHVTVSYTVTVAGSSTDANPSGTPVIFGSATATASDFDLVEGGGFAGFDTIIAGSNLVAGTLTPPGGFTVFESDQSNAAADPTDPNHMITATYSNTSTVQVLFGLTAGNTDVMSGRNSFFELAIAIPLDSDGDGIADHLDIDSDDDGITDNIEAQSTDGYIAPSGTGLGITDVNQDGLDDIYDARNGSLTTGSAAATSAESIIIPQDTDGLGNADFLDPDSDDDGILDVNENGLDVTFVAGDTDGDGLADVFETALDGNVNDGFVVNEGISPLDGTLPDTDGDAGGTIVPGTADLDFRDIFDTDGDGVADNRDVDDDNDGILDSVEGDGSRLNWIAGSSAGVGAQTATIAFSDVTANLTVSTDTGLFRNTADTSVIAANESSAGQGIYTIDSDVPLNDPQIFIGGLGTNNSQPLIGNFTLTLADGTVINNAAFEIIDMNGEFSLSASDTELATIVTVGGNQYLTDPTNNGGNNQATALIRFTDLIVSGDVFDPNNAVTQITFENIGDGIGPTFVFGLTAVDSPDTDGDGITNRLDIDSDNDGITDNVEAQTTAGYIAPSGVGGTPEFTDVDGDGLDDNYDADTSAASTSTTSVGLIPVNTDAGADTLDDTPDFLDTDSDNDGLNDTVEAGLGSTPATGLSDAATDTDGDGLFNVFEDTNINDGFDVNDTNLDATDTNFNLPGVPALNADGSNAVPLVTDLDFRDINDDPVVDTAIPDMVAVDGQTVSIAPDFSDPDGDIIGYSAAGLPAGLSINPLTGEISGEIDNSASQVGPNNDGVYTITVTANDSNGGTSTDEFTLTVTNPAPVVDTAVVDQAAVDGETISITPDFVDPDGDALGYTVAGLPAGLSIDALTGEITGTIDNSASQLGPNSDGVYTIAVTVFDNEGGTVTDTFELTVTNPAPDAIDDALSGTEDTLTTANVITASDSDPDGDMLTVSAVDGVEGNVGTAVSGDNGGLFTIDANGELSFDPNGEFEGLDVGETAISTVTYEVSDGEGGFDTATVTMTIMGMNDAPIVTGTFATQNGVDSAAQIPFDASTIFSDPDGEALSFTSPDLPAWMSINPATGVITGTPPADASQGGLAGEYIITVIATDPDGESVSQTINYNFINPAPVVDTAVANQNAVDGEVISIPSGFVDPDGDVLEYTASGLPAGLLIDPVTGEISGTIDNSASQVGPNGDGVYTVAVTANDSEGGVVTDTFAFAITNPAPDAIDDALTGDEDTVTTGNVITASDSDPDGDALTVSAVNGVAGNVGTPIAGDNGGLFTIDANGELSFDPNGEFEGLDVGETAVSTVTYEISDGEGGFDTATVAFTVTGMNDAPIVTGTLTAQTGADGTAQLPFDASTVFDDPDGEALSFTSPDLPVWMSINPATGVITGTPPADASQGGPNNDGVYTVTVIGTDADGETVSTTVNYTFTNPAPVVDTAIGPQAAEDGETVSLLSSISDPDGDDLAYTASGLPAGLTIDPVTGEITGVIDPSASQNGPNSDGVYTITITADDGEGGTITDTFDLTITNPAPIAENDTAAATEDTPSVTGSVFDDNGNGLDVDPDGDTLVVSEVDGDPALVGQPIAGDLGGVFTIESDGSYTFETNGDFEGLDVGETATTTVTYQVSDGEGGFDTATIEIEVTGENDAPVLIDPNDPNNPSPSLPAQMGDDSFALTSFNVSEFFVDPDGELNLYNIENAPSWLTIDNFSGVITGTPPLDASQGGPNGDGVYPITVVVTDFDGAETREIINYTIANPAPTATDDNFMAAEDGPGIIGNVISVDNGNGIDSDPDGDTLFVEEVNGSSADVGAPIAGSTGGLFTVNADGSYSFDPSGDFEDLDVGETRATTITYLVSDGEGGTDLATVTVTIDGSNDAPIVIDPITGLPPVDANAIIPAQIGDDSANLMPLDVTPFFTDVDIETLSFSSPDLPAWMMIDPDTGVITGTPPLDASQGGPNGDGVYDVTIIATDPDGESVSTIVSYTIANPVPIAQDDIETTDEDTVLTGSIFPDNGNGADIDPDGDVLVVTQVNGVAITSGDVITLPSGALLTINADGSYDYDPNGQFEDLAVNEFGTDSFTYQISDNEGGFDTATVSLTISGTNDAPIPVDPSQPEAPIDPNFPVDPTDPREAPLNPLDYIPAQTATDDVPVTPLDLTPFFGDPDGSDAITLSVDPADLPLGLTFDGTSISGTPDNSVSQGGPNGDGVYTIAVTATDPSGESFTTFVTYDFSNPAPVVDTAIGPITAADAETVSIPSAISDPDGDDLAYTATGLPAGLTIDPVTGEITGEIDNSASQAGPNGDGVYTITVTADDGEGGTVTDTFELTVTNPAPIAADDVASATEDTPVSGNVITASDVDPDGDELSVAEVNGDPALVGLPVAGDMGGLITINSDGSYTFEPNGDFEGLDVGETAVTTITYLVTDSEGGTSQATITITVTGENDAPIVTGTLTGQTSDDSVAQVPFDASTVFSDVDGEPLSFSSPDLPVWMTIDPVTGVITGTPPADASQGGLDGVYEVTVIATDPDGEMVETTVTYTFTNPAPVVDTAIGPITAADAETVSIPSAISDPDGDTLTYSVAGLPAGLTIDPATGEITGEIDNSASIGGLNGDGVYTVTVTADDGEGGTVTDTFELTVTNPAPVVDTAIGPITAADAETVSIPSAISDPDGDDLAYTATGLPAGLTIDPVTGEITGEIDNSASQAGPNGDGVYTITVTADDGEGGTVTDTFELTVTNPAPIAADDVASATEDAPVSGNVITASDVDPDGDVLSVAEVNGDPALVGQPVAGDMGGLITINSDGSYTFEPNGDFEGLDVGETAVTTITYLVTDSEGGTSQATITIKVTGENDAPIVTGTLTGQTSDDSVAQVPFDASTVFSDVDGEPLSFSSPDLPVWMTIDPVTGVITGTPPADASQGGLDGVYEVTVIATDPDGEMVETTVTYTFTNPAPVVDTAIGPITAADAETVSIPSAISDPDGDTLTYSVAGLPAGLTIDPATGEITGEIDNSASIGGLNGDGVYTVTVTADDGEGGTVTDTFELTVTNPAPVVGNDSYTVAEDTPLLVNVLSNDSDPDGDAIVIDAVALPDGTIVPVGVATEIPQGTLTVNADGSTLFEPRLNFFGPVTFGYTISDGQGGTDVATVTIDVTAVNDGPIPVDPSQIVIPGDNPDVPTDPEDPRLPVVDPSNFIPLQSASDGTPIDGFDLTPFFGDPDPTETLVISLDPSELPSGLSFNPSTGIISGTPDSDASQGGDPNNPGTYVVAVTVTDPSGETFTTNITYVIENLAPEAANDGPLDVVEDTPAVLDLLGNDTDADGDDIVITEINGSPVTIGVPVTLPSGATVTLNPDGTVEYSPVENYSGPDNFTYSVSDGEGGADTAEVVLNVTAINDAPELIPLDENVKLGEDDNSGVLLPQTNTDGEMITPVDISAGFTDVDDTALTFTATGLPPGLTLNPETGIIEGTLTSGASIDGPYSVTITATDPNGESISTVFVWTIENVAPIIDPIIVPPSIAGENVTIDIGNAVVDPDGDIGLIYSAEGLPPGLVIDPDTGVISGMPTVPQADPYVIIVTVNDGQGGVTTAEVNVQVNDAVYIGQDVTQDQLILEDGVDPYGALEDKPIELQKYFHERALESRDANGRMFGDRDFKGGMLMSQIPGYEAGYLVVEAVAYEHNINVQLATTLDAFAGTQVQNWDVSLASGAPMPDWVEYVPGADFMEITRPLNQESIELRIRALLDNGQTATTTTQINLNTGAVTELSQVLSQAQTLGDQLTLETKRLAEGSSDLLQALAS